MIKKVYPQALCNPVLGDTKTIHAKYFKVFVLPDCGTKIVGVGVHCLY